MILDAPGCSLFIFKNVKHILIFDMNVMFVVMFQVPSARFVCGVLLFACRNTCFASLPSGNQVNGLPLVGNSVLLESNAGEGVIGPSVGSELCMGRDPLILLNFFCLCQI